MTDPTLAVCKNLVRFRVDIPRRIGVGLFVTISTLFFLITRFDPLVSRCRSKPFRHPFGLVAVELDEVTSAKVIAGLAIAPVLDGQSRARREKYSQDRGD